jgi:RNA-directed DNA polymerase
MRKQADFSLVLHARELDQSTHEARQMTTVKAVGAASGEATEWYAIDWPTIHRNVRRLQVRIAQATKERRWGKVQALQRLLTHSYSGKVLAVRRVTENTGKKTPGVDQEIWDTPEKKKRRHRQYRNSGVEAINLNLCDVFTSRNRTAKRCARSESPP